MKSDELATITTELALMFHSFPQSAKVDVDLQMEAYVRVVEQFEFVDIMAAIKRIMEGGEGHEYRSTVTSTAELASEIRRRADMRQIIARRAQAEKEKSVKNVRKS